MTDDYDFRRNMRFSVDPETLKINKIWLADFSVTDEELKAAATAILHRRCLHYSERDPVTVEARAEALDALLAAAKARRR
jgi:hypothetical protein